MSSVMVSVNTTMVQITEMSQRKKPGLKAGRLCRW